MDTQGPNTGPFPAYVAMGIGVEDSEAGRTGEGARRSTDLTR